MSLDAMEREKQHLAANGVNRPLDGKSLWLNGVGNGPKMVVFWVWANPELEALHVIT